MRKKITLKNTWAHFRKIQKHRKYVRQYCFWAGIPWRGITHDLSKYSPVEFWESVKFYVGTSSPINEAKKCQGYSLAWLHHRGRNRHHWAYWVDNFSEGMTVYMMPKDDFVEMVCDFLGAGHAYSENKFSYTAEHAWWLRERDKDCKAMHPKNKQMLDIIFSDLEKAENPELIGDDGTFFMQDWIPTPKQLIKSGYIQQVWEANK